MYCSEQQSHWMDTFKYTCCQGEEKALDSLNSTASRQQQIPVMEDFVTLEKARLWDYGLPMFLTHDPHLHIQCPSHNDKTAVLLWAAKASQFQRGVLAVQCPNYGPRAHLSHQNLQCGLWTSQLAPRSGSTDGYCNSPVTNLARETFQRPEASPPKEKKCGCCCLNTWKQKE